MTYTHKNIYIDNDNAKRVVTREIAYLTVEKQLPEEYKNQYHIFVRKNICISLAKQKQQEMAQFDWFAGLILVTLDKPAALGEHLHDPGVAVICFKNQQDLNLFRIIFDDIKPVHFR